MSINDYRLTAIGCELCASPESPPKRGFSCILGCYGPPEETPSERNSLGSVLIHVDYCCQRDCTGLRHAFASCFALAGLRDVVRPRQKRNSLKSVSSVDNELRITKLLISKTTPAGACASVGMVV